jgi:hypothetical protein
MPKPPFAALLVLVIGLGPAAAAHAQGQLVPPGREPGAKPYDPFARDRAADDEQRGMPAMPPPPAFRITVPMCQRAERLGDPLAKTPECTLLLKAAEDQAKACKQAFEDGDDKAAMSAACRQGAGFR